MAEATEHEHELATLTYVEMGVVVELPVGWELQADEDGDLLVCIGPDTSAVDGLAPSITIRRDRPLGDEGELPALAAAVLEERRAVDPELELLEELEEPGRVVRAYRYAPKELGQPVHQTEAILAWAGTYVVTATAPLATADAWQPVFARVLASLRVETG